MRTLSCSFRAAVSRRAVVSVAVAMLLALIPVLTYGISEPFPVVPVSGFAVVASGPMDVTIQQKGEVRSSRNVHLLSRCEWSVRLLSIVPEGTWVEKGEVVAVLDSSMLQTRYKEREVLYVQAEAELRRAEQDLEIQKITNESRLSKARLQVQTTKLLLESARDADHPRQLHQLEGDLTIAEENLSRARKKLDFLANVVALGYRTPAEYDAQHFQVLKSEQAVELTRSKLANASLYSQPRSLKELTAKHEEAQRNLKRIQSLVKASMLSREVKLSARTKSAAALQQTLDRYQRSIDACTVRAARSGQIVYGKGTSGASRAVREGDMVRYLQPLAELPDRDQMEVVVRLHEARIRLIEPGQPCWVTLDSMSGAPIAGNVASISSLPLSGREPHFDLREYEVVVKVDAPVEIVRQLAPGLTAQTQILAARRSEAVLAPVESIVQVGGRYVAFVLQGDDVVARDVEIGLSSDHQVEVLAGLQPGQQIVQQPRITCAQRIVWLESQRLASRDQLAWADLITL